MSERDSSKSIRYNYKRVMGHLDALIAFSIALDLRFNGEVALGSSQQYAVPIFVKQTCHAISLRKLLPDQFEGTDAELWDFGSTCALARCVIDAYDALAYFALDQVTEQERNFRELLSELHDQERRDKVLALVGSTQPEAVAIRLNVAALRARVQSHHFFPSLLRDQQTKIAKGDAPQYYLSQKERNQAGGIDHRHYLSATIYLSQFVHTTPMAINQWRHLRAGAPETVRAMTLPMQHALPYFSKGVHAIMKMFPADDPVPELVAEVFDFWLPVAERGVPGRGSGI